jgi:hypothetical protein
MMDEEDVYLSSAQRASPPGRKNIVAARWSSDNTNLKTCRFSIGEILILPPKLFQRSGSEKSALLAKWGARSAPEHLFSDYPILVFSALLAKEYSKNSGVHR